MKTILFTYETPIGTFWIHPEPADRVRLGIDAHKLRTYASPKAAARAVAEQSTGWEAWDTAKGILIPSGLERWKRAPGHRHSKKEGKPEKSQLED